MSILVSRSIRLIIILGCFSASASMVDLMYLPEYGKVSLDLGYKYDNKNFNNRSSTSRIINYEMNDNKTTAYTKLSYSPFNELKIGVGLDYQITGEKEQKQTNGTPFSKIEKTGLIEPEVFAHFRMLKEKDFIFNVDGLVSLAPSFDMGEEEVTSKKTSARRGGALYSGTLFVGKKMEDFAVRGHLKVDFNGERELEDIFSGLKTVKYDSRVDFTGGVTVQLRFSDMHGIEAGVDYINIGENKKTLVISNIEQTEDSYSIISLRAGYKGEFIEDFLVFYANFEYHKLSDYNITTISSSPSSSASTENIDGNQQVISSGIKLKF